MKGVNVIIRIKEKVEENWIIYHKLIGIQHFYVYGNEEQPKSLEKYIMEGIVTYNRKKSDENLINYFINMNELSTGYIIELREDEYIRVRNEVDINKKLKGENIKIPILNNGEMSGMGESRLVIDLENVSLSYNDQIIGKNGRICEIKERNHIYIYADKNKVMGENFVKELSGKIMKMGADEQKEGVNKYIGTVDGKYCMSICLMVRDDHDYIEEWIDYHRMIGVDHFYITDNLSSPPLKDILQKYIDEEIVTYRYDTRVKPQIPVYNECIKEHGEENSWIGFIDSDEFLVLKKHNNIRDFMMNYEEYGALSVCWYLFGNNGHLKKQKSIINSYTKRSWKSDAYKTIVQPKTIKEYNIHNVSQHKEGYYTVDEKKCKVSGALVKNESTEYIQLNHYVLRSLEDFEEKRERGGGTNPHGKNISYFETVNKISIIYDISIIDWIQKIKY